MQITNNKPNNIDEYIQLHPKNIQEILTKIRKTITELAPQATETIKYQIPTFKLGKRNLVHFGAYKNFVSFYPTPSALIAFSKELAPYETSKGAVRFQLDEPIPYDLIKKMVRFRIQEEVARLSMKRMPKQRN
jgi:uncharacterized protein YdhG (YjbR/CyaY superfamily)